MRETFNRILSIYKAITIILEFYEWEDDCCFTPKEQFSAILNMSTSSYIQWKYEDVHFELGERA